MTADHNLQSKASASDWVIPDPGDAGAIPNYLTGVVELVSATSETRTLAAPVRSGLMLTLCFKTDGGDCVVTCATTVNITNNTIITFDTAGECIVLISIADGSTYRWRAIACVPEADTASLSS